MTVFNAITTPVGLAAGAALLIAVLAACGTSRVRFGKDEVGYNGSATRAEARALGEALMTAHYFRNLGVTVLLSKDKRGTTISYATKEGVWDNEASVAQYGSLTTHIAPIVGGLPVTMRLVNYNFDTQKEQVIQTR